MENYFKISDFCISADPIPQDIADKILTLHILPGNKVRKALGIPIWPSAKSGYRPLKWELEKGRSGNSQHVFRGNGAVDWTCRDFEENKFELLKHLIEQTEYTRFAIYETFLHCDYAGLDRWVYDENWVKQYEV